MAFVAKAFIASPKYVYACISQKSRCYAYERNNKQ